MEDTLTPRPITKKEVEEGEILTPLPTGKSVTMSFYDALKKLNDGKCITRIAWGNTDYCLMKDGFLSIFINGDFHRWSISEGDVEPCDWTIIKPYEKN